MTTKPSPRNAGFDFLKYICAFMVICLHTQYAGKSFFEPYTRIAVPCFAMITGYYYSSMKQRGRIKRQILSALMLLLLSNLIYFIWKFGEALLSGSTPRMYFSVICTPKTLMEFLLLNHSPFSYHLWYLGSHLYVLVLIALFERKWDRSRLYPAILPLLLVNLALGNYSYELFGRILPSFYSRNFFFLGLPFFLLGDCIHRRQITPRNRTLAVGFALCAAITPLEHAFLTRSGQAVNTDLYVSSILMAALVFLFFSRSRRAFSNKAFQAVAFMGRHFSSDIYIIHLIFISIANKTLYAPRFWGTGYTELYERISNLVILAASTVFAFIVYRIKKAIKAPAKG